MEIYVRKESINNNHSNCCERCKDVWCKYILRGVVLFILSFVFHALTIITFCVLIIVELFYSLCYGHFMTTQYKIGCLFSILNYFKEGCCNRIREIGDDSDSESEG